MIIDSHQRKHTQTNACINEAVFPLRAMEWVLILRAWPFASCLSYCLVWHKCSL